MVAQNEGFYSPEQSQQPVVNEPHFVFLFDPSEAIKVTLHGIYEGMRTDPQGYLRSLGQFAQKPHDRPPGFDWYPLMERGPDSFPLYLAFEFDEATTAQIDADTAYQDLQSQGNNSPDEKVRKIRIRAFEIFLDQLRVARGIGNASLEDAA